MGVAFPGFRPGRSPAVVASARERIRVSFHYRCRCGQEVVLRPREGMYLAIGALVGISILNTILLFILWGKLGEAPPADPRSGETDPSRQEASERTHPAETPRAVDPPISQNRGSTEAPPTRPAEVTETGESSEAALTSVSEVAPPAEPLSPPPTPTPPPAPEVLELRLDRPEGLELPLLAQLLDEFPVGTLDRTLLLLAVCRWGEDLSIRGSDLLRAESPLLFEALSPSEGPTDSRLLLRRTIDPGHPRDRAVRGELAALDQVWESRWRTILERARSDPSHGWRTAVGKAGGEGPVDLVLLVDLSESMVDEIDALRSSLRAMVPELLTARPSFRLGWVGYRDEVVDRLSLTSDPSVLVESFDRFRCEGGGDVPEALDEALFEAFRVGSFPWRPEARHRLVVVGDAPPPYERIEGMIELARAAHESPEAFTLDALGVLREEEFPRVPSFLDLAEATAGEALFLRPHQIVPESWWRLLIGESSPAWQRAPSQRP